MKYFVTGASGLVGQGVVNQLISLDCDVIAVGRDRSVLQKLFPTVVCLSNDELDRELSSDARLIHLAIVNNGAVSSQEEFDSGNVKFLNVVLEACVRNGIDRFVYTSSTHVTRGKNDIYTNSKREAESIVGSYSDKLDTRVVRLSAVVGQGAKGKQKVLYLVPKYLRIPAMKLINIFIPVVTLEKATDQILQESLEVQKVLPLTSS